MRLNEETPAKKAIREYLHIEKRKIGRPCTTWMATILKDFDNIGINIDSKNPETAYNDLISLTKDRKNIRKR